MEEQKKMKTSRKENWIVKVRRSTVINSVHDEGKEKAVAQALSELRLKQTNEQ